MTLWSAKNLKKYAHFCIPIVLSARSGKYEIFDIDENGIGYELDVPWNKKRDMIMTKRCILQNIDTYKYGKGSLKSWFRTLYEYKEYLKTCKMR